jgi:tRNA wybutosine-synthesizing protein 1
VEGRWHTWIDYDRFFDLVASKRPFKSLDYIAPTPDWAVYGHPAHGFDPVETRFHRKSKGAKAGEAEADDA